MEETCVVKKRDIPKLVSILLKDSPDDADALVPAVPNQLEVNWPVALVLVARDLCTDSKLKMIKKSLLQPGQVNKADVLTQILELWVQEKRKFATVEMLITTLSSNGLESIAALIKPGTKNDEYSQSSSISSSSSTSGIENSAQTKALMNSVILEEIFKKLSIKDRKSFRLVSKLWLTETLPFWRRSTWLAVSIHSENENRSLNSISPIPPMDFQTLLKLLRGHTAPSPEADGMIGINKSNLEKYPFRKLSIFSHVFLPKRRKNKMFEEIFWRLCGPHVTHLKLNDGIKLGSNLEVLEKLLLETCPKLEELLVESRMKQRVDFGLSGLNSWESCRRAHARKGTVARGLRTLQLSTFSQMSIEVCANILKLCPNLKTLRGQNMNMKYIQALLQLATNGEVVKLEKLATSCSSLEEFAMLREYFNMAPSSMEHVELEDVVGELARSAPFNFYKALATQRSSLKTLHLHYKQSVIRENFYFMDLSAIRFQKLTKLVLQLELTPWMELAVRFDFGTLNSLPMLEELEIRWMMKVLRSQSQPSRRKPRILDDYLYEGDRDLYVDFADGGAFMELDGTDGESYSDQDEDLPVRGKKLKKLTFNCWPLTSNDIQLLSSWFPNLTYLNAILTTEEAVSTLLESWDNLKTLFLNSRSTLSLKQLHMIKQKRDSLEIIQDSKQFPKIVVTKGQKGDILVEEFVTD